LVEARRWERSFFLHLLLPKSGTTQLRVAPLSYFADPSEIPEALAETENAIRLTPYYISTKPN
ncbi:hypothetical protein ACJVXU_09425, partial [Staphylococcus pseudintermedius]